MQDIEEEKQSLGEDLQEYERQRRTIKREELSLTVGEDENDFNENRQGPISPPSVFFKCELNATKNRHISGHVMNNNPFEFNSNSFAQTPKTDKNIFVQMINTE